MSISLCLNTLSLLSYKNPIEVSVLTKSATKVDVKVDVITKSSIFDKSGFASWKSIATDFEFNKFQKFVQQTRENHSSLRLASNIQDYVSKNYHKYLFDCFHKILKQNLDCPVTFKYKSDTGQIVNRKYSLDHSLIDVTLVVGYDDEYKLCTRFEFRALGQTLSIDEIYVFDFFVLFQDRFFLIPYNQFLQMHLITNLDMTTYYFDAQSFNRDILVEMEKKINIRREASFPYEDVLTDPENQLLISESGNLLLLAPQTRYQNILAPNNEQQVFEKYEDGLKLIITRNLDAEADFRSRIKASHPNFKSQKLDSFFLTIEEAKKKNWFLKFYHELLEQGISVIGLDMLSQFRYSPHAIQSTFEILDIRDNDAFIKLEVYFGREKISLKELKKAILSNQKMLLLEDNSMGVLTDDWLNKYSILIKHSEWQDNILTTPKWILLFNPELSSNSPQTFSIDLDMNHWWQDWKLWQESENIVYPISLSIHATLRPYQQKGYEWMILLSKIGAGACLADDMGLGKTLQTICFLDFQKIKTSDKVHLIICPSSLIYNWKNEIEKFAPHMNVKIYHGGQRSLQCEDGENPDILITSYGTVRQDIFKIEDITWNTIVLDESHNIKNIQADTTKSVLRLKAISKVILSGTPILNSTQDLYSQLSFILPGYFGTSSFFSSEYVLPIERDKNKDRMEILKRMTSPFILRRTKEQVATDLPPKIESILWCSLGSAQRTYYDNVRNQIKSNILIDIKNQGFAATKFSVLDGISKLRRLCSTPYEIEGVDDFSEESIKIDLLIDELTGNLSQNKVLVFSQFLNSLGTISEKLKYANIPFYIIDGSTPQKQRQEFIDRFQSDDDKVMVFLVSLKAGNTGFTLTAANYVFLLDPWWNRQVENQAIDRVYRIGQDKSVFAYRMICKDTIEEKIIQLQNRKQSVSDELISEDDGFVKNLSTEDVEFLFS
jgi:SNF2 family DNA or RNA helicase